MSTTMPDFDPAAELNEIQTATDRFLLSISPLDADAFAAPSLLPSWTRGHVCAHLAGNADGLINLLTWARTGVETPMYPPGEGREQAIEAGAGRAPPDHAAAVRSSAGAFARAVADLAPEHWDVEVQWRGGAVTPARTVLWARLREVEIHHVDLDLAYTPARWADEFSAHVIANATSAFRRLDPPPSFDLHATDTGEQWQLGQERSDVVVSGAQAALLAWLIGRSSGDGLAVDGPDGHGTTLPRPPVWI
jgi:maleylpyruvate isomerase